MVVSKVISTRIGVIIKYIVTLFITLITKAHDPLSNPGLRSKCSNDSKSLGLRALPLPSKDSYFKAFGPKDPIL